MAIIAGYKDVYTAKAYEDRVDDITESLMALYGAQSMLEKGKNEIIHQIEVLKAKEKRIFELLNVNNIEQLNQNIEEYKRATWAFSGAGLNQTFIAILKEKNQAEYEAFSEAVLEVINNEIANGEDFKAGIRKRVFGLVMTELNKGRSSKGGLFHSARGYTNEGIFPASFTKEQKERWEHLLKEKFNYLPKVSKYLKLKNNNSDSNSINTTFTWFGITNELTTKQAQELYVDGRLTEGEINHINYQLTQKILSTVPSKDRWLVERIINHVIERNIFAFFVGRNEKEITGILGEIQGIYYLAKLLGDDYLRAIEWRGGTFTGEAGKKPHQDIVLKDLGIQVKNTTKQELFDMKDVNFTSLDLETFLDRLEKLGISQEARYLFENFFATSNFNVPYHKRIIENSEKKKIVYEPGINMEEYNAKKFMNSYNQLQSLSDDIDILLSIFAATLMYLDVSEDAQQLDANVLFLLGGTAFQTASNILSEILKVLNNQSLNNLFKVSSYRKTDRTIIDVLNSGDVYNSYTNIVKSDIKLQSSFNFSIFYKT